MRKFGAMLGIFCVATMLAEVLALSYLFGTGRLSRDRLARIIAVVHGAELQPAAPAAAGTSGDGGAESLEETSQALKQRHLQLDMRASLIEGHLLGLEAQRQRFQVEKDRFVAARDAFQKQLDTWAGGERAQALDEAVLLLGKLRPDQAKGQLMLMLEKGEIDSVVALMRKLPTDRQAKIAGEFTTREESEKLGEILRHIRDGEPRVPLAERTREALGER